MRRRNLIVAMAATIASGLSLAGPAQAFDSGDCNSTFGAANVIDVDQFSKDTGTSGRVDFGDHMHLGGAPQGTAVACWSSTGRVLLKGYLFSDPVDGDYADVKAVIDFRPNAGLGERREVSIPAPTVVGGMFHLPKDKIANFNIGRPGTTFNRVTIRLLADGELIDTIIRSRG